MERFSFSAAHSFSFWGVENLFKRLAVSNPWRNE
jgi:hypothetical protein